MTTPRDLLIVAMDMPSGRTIERGDLSLALAGAEAVDLLAAGAIRLADERMVPGRACALGDALLDAAAASVAESPPDEPVGEWLWRRGRGLAGAYLDAMEAAGLLTREARRRWLVRSTSLLLVDSAARSRARHRNAADEPVLAGLAATIGLTPPHRDGVPPITDSAAAAVLAAVTEAVTELSEERLRRDRRLADAAADNVRRGY
ncbi:GOLPH3/VPS74 family protein [Actinacidiphila rubida]|uniref:Golgi phosphoprotein 3 (GPP34) n=1 Tax=Actinacidiphila rubida TaxID=310780 RepID=A0A1H8DAB3_9ACTN|nr:GPP34 family phosphoprotein [Actinacidiphila rubida]SEN04202.1 Golgi phosphoprotein 3 (GPP34) [Actinacidiphila rubida]